MSAALAAAVAAPPAPSRALARQVQQQRAAAARPVQQQRRAVRVAAEAGNGAGGASSPVIGAPQQQHVIRMVNLVQAYFDTLLTEGDVSILDQVLDQNISHKDMVRNIGRVGMKEYAAYLAELHQTYPDYYVRSTNFGFVDNRMMFASFEGQVSAKTPKFYGVDLFIFNEDATKITEVQVYRSNWLGAQGHEERKKLAEAAAAAQAAATQQRGQLP